MFNLYSMKEPGILKPGIGDGSCHVIFSFVLVDKQLRVFRSEFLDAHLELDWLNAYGIGWSESVWCSRSFNHA